MGPGMNKLGGTGRVTAVNPGRPFTFCASSHTYLVEGEEDCVIDDSLMFFFQ
jgi:hypothetical protein